MGESSQWLSTKEAAERLGITSRTLYRLIDEGKIDAYQMGRVFRVMAKDVESFLEASKIKPGTLAHLYPEPAGVKSDED
jgi:excisionase family DNA binding protein